MAEYRQALVRFLDEDEPVSTLVSIGEAWTEENDDPRIFFYFEDEAEFERAKQTTDEFEFQVMA